MLIYNLSYVSTVFNNHYLTVQVIITITMQGTENDMNRYFMKFLGLYNKTMLRFSLVQSTLMAALLGRHTSVPPLLLF